MTTVPVHRLEVISANGKLTVAVRRFAGSEEMFFDCYGEVKTVVPLSISLLLPNLSAATGMYWFNNQVVNLRHRPLNLEPLDSGE